MKLYFLLLFSFLTTISAVEISITVDAIKVTSQTAEKLNLRSPGKSYTNAQYSALLGQLKKSKQGIKVFSASRLAPNGNSSVTRNVTTHQSHLYKEGWKAVPRDVGLTLEVTSQANGNIAEMEIKLQCSFLEDKYKFENKNLTAIKEIIISSRLNALNKSIQNIAATKVDEKYYYVFMLHTNILNQNNNPNKNNRKNIIVLWDTLKVKSSEVESLGLNIAGKKFSKAQYSKIIDTIKTRNIGYIDDSSSSSSVSQKTVQVRNTKDLIHYNEQDKIHTRSFGSIFEYTPIFEPNGAISVDYKPQLLKIIGYRKKNAPILNTFTQGSRTILNGEYMVIGSSQKGPITYISILSAASSDITKK